MPPSPRFPVAAVSVGILLLGTATSCSRPQPPNLPKLNGDRFAARVRSQLDQARAAAASQPRDAALSGRLGMMLHAYEEYAAAIVCYRRAAILDPRSHRWAYYLANALAALGQKHESLEWLRQAARLDPGYHPGQRELAASLSAAGRHQEALPIAQRQAEANPDSAHAHFVLGQVLRASGRSDLAAAELRRACRIAPSFATAHYALAITERALGNNEAASAEFALHARFRGHRPHSEDPLLQELPPLDLSPYGAARRAAYLINEGSLFDAIAVFESIIRHDPGYQVAYAGIIALYHRLGMHGAAAQFYQSTVSEHPHFYDVHFNFAVLNLDARNLDKAQSLFQLVLAHDPNHVEAHVQLGRLLEMRGKQSAADSHFRTALHLHSTHPQANYLLGRGLLRTGNIQQALPFMRTAARQAKDDQVGWYLRALSGALARGGRRREAIETAQSALQAAYAWNQADLVAALRSDLITLHDGGTHP
jgi:tetratricopeptide (TPR) repeat protein